MHLIEILIDFDWPLAMTHVANPMQWLTTISYFAAAFVSHHAGKTGEKLAPNSKISRRSFIFWRTVMILMVIFGVTELFDIQLFLTHFARQISKTFGWYNQRAPIQKLVIWGFILTSITTFIYSLILFRHFLWRNALALFGTAFLCGFVAVRAVSYHHVDSFLCENFAGIQLNWICELMAIFFICLSGIICIKATNSMDEDIKLYLS